MDTKIEDEMVDFVWNEKRRLESMEYDTGHLVVVVGGKYAPILHGKLCYGLPVKSVLSDGVDMLGIMTMHDYLLIRGLARPAWDAILVRGTYPEIVDFP